MDTPASIFEEVEEDLKFIATSAVRAKMLMNLLEKPKTSTILKDELGVGASTVIHAARDLEKHGYLVEKADGYHLTTIGKITTYKLIELIKTLRTLRKSQEFWLTHAVEGVPEKFLREMYKLWNHEILRASVRNVFKTLSVYLELSKKAKKFWGVSPIFVSAFVTLVKKLAARNAEVKLVLTKEVFEEVKKSHKDVLQEVMPKIEIWIIEEEPKVAFTVTDSFLSLGLFGEDGVYDPTYDIISREKEAIEWGRELFEYYKSRARKVTMEDL